LSKPFAEVIRVVVMRYAYDDADRLVRVCDGTGNATCTSGNRIEYTLDAAGNRTIERTFDSSGVLRRRLARQFDALGRLDKSRDSLDAAGNPLAGAAILDRNTGIGLLQDRDDLGLAELRLAHGKPPGRANMPESSTSKVSGIRGRLRMGRPRCFSPRVSGDPIVFKTLECRAHRAGIECAEGLSDCCEDKDIYIKSARRQLNFFQCSAHGL
jgi:hypothetical protein